MSDLENRLAEALAAANKFRAERDELRLKMAEGIRVYAINRALPGTTAYFAEPVFADPGNAVLILDDSVEL